MKAYLPVRHTFSSARPHSYAVYALLLALAGCGGGGSSGDPASTSSNGGTSAAGTSLASGANNNVVGSTNASGTASSGTSSSSSSSAATPPATSLPAGALTSSNVALKMSCAAPVLSSAASASALITADTPSTDSTRMFAAGSTFPLTITTQANSADTLTWSIADTVGKTVASGSFATPAGPTTATFSCTSTLAGYFAISATLANAGGQVQTAGTRPTGFATFGVLPDVAAILPAPTYAHQEQHRFGMQGFNGWTTMLQALGISSTIDDREISSTEPNGPNTFTPSGTVTDPGYLSGQIMRLVRLDGISAWDSSTGAVNDTSTLPVDLAGYQSYMSLVGTDTELIREKYYPNQSANDYQVTWEPDVNWTGSNADFVTLYKTVYAGLHATDPHAVVMGPTDSFPSLTTTHLKALAPLGFAQYVDGITTHGYYDAGTSPSHPPERLATDPSAANAANALMNEMRGLRTEMNTDYRAGMKLFVTETGISYDLGTQYGPNYPSANVLFAQGAVVARTHLILLGEGADQTYVFYGADYPGEPGYGTFFDLADAQGAWGATNISPKPAAMAVAAMTRLLDGTITLGPVNGTPSGVYAYAFQQRGAGNAITALWTHNNAVWSATTGFSQTHSVAYQLAVDAPGTSGTVQVLDMMGNPTTVSYTNGTVSLNLSEAPVYVISPNASVAKANATTPLGYLGT
jgi:hypothetical protein